MSIKFKNPFIFYSGWKVNLKFFVEISQTIPLKNGEKYRNHHVFYIC